MTYPQVTISFRQDAPIPKPPDGDVSTSLNRATYYPTRWKLLEDTPVLLLLYDLDHLSEEATTTNGTPIFDTHNIRQTDEELRIYVPLADVKYWTTSN